MTERVVASVFGGFHIFVVYAPYCEVETRSWHWGTRSLGWEVSLLCRLADTHGWVLGLAWYCMLPYWIAFRRASRGTIDEDMECVTPYNTDLLRLLSLWHLSSWQHVIHHQEMLNSHSVSCGHIKLSLYYLQLFLIPLLLNRPALLKPHSHQPEGSSGNIGFRWRTRSRETSQIFGGADSTKWVRQIRRWDVLTYWTTRVCLGYG